MSSPSSTGALPHATNNVAEYQRPARRPGVVRQPRRRTGACAFRLAAAGPADARRLQGQARGPPAAATAGRVSLAHQIGKVQYEHVPRELNKEADRLANRAMDEAAMVAADRKTGADGAF